MTRLYRIAVLSVSTAAVAACSAVAQPVPNLRPDRTDQDVATAVQDELDSLTQEVDDAFEQVGADDSAGANDVNSNTSFDGFFTQGGLVTGETEPGTRITLDGDVIPVDIYGNFVFGFDRDHGPTATIEITDPSGLQGEPLMFDIEERAWRVSRITVENRLANPYSREDLEKIDADRTLKSEARATRADTAYWADGFAWPVQIGCVSSPFGYQRIINDTPRRYHSGVDIAAPDGMSPLNYVGTPIYAPADGIIRLAEEGMFFEGGMVFIDHGQRLESAIMHMSAVHVGVGDRVSQGDLIGEVGSTGRVTGPHMHWSLKWGSRLVDPELIVDERPICTD